MSSDTVEEQCALIQTLGPRICNEQLRTAFDAFTSTLSQIGDVQTKQMILTRIILSLASVPYRSKKLANSELVAHELFVIIRDLAINDPLCRRQAADDRSQRLLLEASTLFVHLCSNIDDTNMTTLKSLFFHPPLVDGLTQCLEEIAMQSEYSSPPVLLRSVGFLLVIFKHFHGNQLNKDEHALIAPIFSAVVRCLCSSHATGLILALKSNFTQKLSDDQTLFLNTMPWYLQWYSDYGETDSYLQILRRLLPAFTTWLTNCHPDDYLQCTSKFGTALRHLSYFLVRPIESENVHQFSDEFLHHYCQLVSYWSSVLSFTLTHSSDQLDVKFSTRIIVQNLYNFTLHRNVLNFMKTIPNLISMLSKMAGAHNDELQLHAYRCLGKLMTETDIKTMIHPDQIVFVHMEFLVNTIDYATKTERFHSLLDSLKSFVQHDQVKSELIKQNALPFLVRCVVETRLDPSRVQQVTLEILLALSFNNAACSMLKDDSRFMHRVRALASKVDARLSGLQRAAEGLLWKLEREEEAITKVTNLTSYRYDIMISYSHKDQQICLRIHEQLVKDGFRVWFDRDCLRGSTMMGMANAIENSECVLICMSNSYKQSVYCQSEAHYAFERRCHLIPVIIEPNYKPDGWLGIIVSGKIYVDFAQMDFEFAYGRLKSEISEEEQSRWLSHLSNKSEERCQSEGGVLIRSDDAELVFGPTTDLPVSITQWTVADVKNFLLRLGLGSTLLPLCTRLDGHRLWHLYEMCLLNRESMYQSLKFELNDRHRALLPVADYLTFLHETKTYVPTSTTKNKTSPTSFLSLTLCNIL